AEGAGHPKLAKLLPGKGGAGYFVPVAGRGAGACTVCPVFCNALLCCVGLLPVALQRRLRLVKSWGADSWRRAGAYRVPLRSGKRPKGYILKKGGWPGRVFHAFQGAAADAQRSICYRQSPLRCLAERLLQAILA